MKSYFRFLSRNKLYAAIMAVGLSVSLAFVIIMSCYVWTNYSVTRYYPDSERIYVVSGSGIGHTYRALPDYMYANIPEVESATAVNFTSRMMMGIEGEGWLDTRVSINADSDFFNVFETRFIYGDKEVWDDVNSVIVTKSFAEAHGGKEIVGKTLTVAGEEQIFTIAAVIEDFDKSIFSNYSIIFNLDNPALFGEAPPGLMSFDEIMNGPETFVKLLPKSDAEAVADKFNELHKIEYSQYNNLDFSFISLTQTYFSREHSLYPMLKYGNLELMKIFSAIVVILLISAIFNYVNLSSALTGKRSKEIASRMLLGEHHMEVIRRSIFESLTFVIVCMIFAFMLAVAIMPSINTLIDSPVPLEVDLSSTNLVVYLTIVLLTAIFCSFIPTLISIKFKPIEVVKGRFRYESRRTFSKIFIVIQNAIAIIIIAVVTVMSTQMHHMMDMPLGVNVDNLYQCGLGSLSQNLEADLNQLSYVKKVGRSYGRPGSINYATAVPLSDDNSDLIFLGKIVCDKNAFDMFGYEIVRQYGPTSGCGVWLSESAFEAMKMDLNNPVFPYRWEPEMEFAGIIKDFAMTSALNFGASPATTVFVYPDGTLPNNIGDFIVETEELTSKQKDDLHTLCYEAVKRVHGTDYVNDGYIRDIMNKEYNDMRKQIRMVTIFMLIAIMLSALGQVAMSTYYVTEREKEIGIRKVFGGTVSSESIRNIFEYMVYCLIATVIAVPVAVWIAGRYLETFTYRMDTSPWIYIASSLAVVAVSFLSVFWQTLRAARTNPAEALKKE